MLKRVSTGIGAALLAFAFYGAWAFWVNRPHGLSHAWRALIAQGTSSFITTFALSSLVTLFHRQSFSGGLWRALPPVLSTSVVACGLVIVHSLAGTPAIAATIAPSVGLGFCYAVYCSYLLDARAR